MMFVVWVIAWHVLGLVFLGFGKTFSEGGVLEHSEGFEFVNPLWVYRWNRVNWFGAVVVSTIYAAFCPAGAVIYWFYKLCTVGRK